MTYVHRCLIVAPGDAQVARALAAKLDPAGGAGMFETPVYDEAGTLTGYVSNGWVDPALAAAFDDPAVLAAESARLAKLDGSTAIDAKQCQDILARGDVSAEQASEVIADNGWSLSVEPDVAIKGGGAVLIEPAVTTEELKS